MQFQFRQTDFCIVSIFSPDWGVDCDYDRGASIKLSRSTLEPWWGAWRPVLLAGVGCCKGRNESSPWLRCLGYSSTEVARLSHLQYSPSSPCCFLRKANLSVHTKQEINKNSSSCNLTTRSIRDHILLRGSMVPTGEEMAEPCRRRS